MANRRQLSVSEAKANFRAAMEQIEPLGAVKEHPWAALGLTAAAGVMAGRLKAGFVRKAINAPVLSLAILKKIL